VPQVPTISEVLPLLHLHGLSGDFVPALEQFLGSPAGADGIHLRIRLEEAKAAVLVVMGVRRTEPRS
jgi:putative transposase